MKLTSQSGSIFFKVPDAPWSSLLSSPQYPLFLRQLLIFCHFWLTWMSWHFTWIESYQMSMFLSSFTQPNYLRFTHVIPFLLLSSIPLYKSWFIHLLMEIRITSSFKVLEVKVLWLFMYFILYGHMLSLLLDKYLWMECFHHVRSGYFKNKETPRWLCHFIFSWEVHEKCIFFTNTWYGQSYEF